jgi:hypothetical protein
MIQLSKFEKDPLKMAYTCLFSVNNKTTEAQLSGSYVYTKTRGKYTGPDGPQVEVSFFGPVSWALQWARSHDQHCVLLLTKEGPRNERHAYLYHLKGEFKDKTEHLGLWVEFPAWMRNHVPNWTRIVGPDKSIHYYTTKGK